MNTISDIILKYISDNKTSFFGNTILSLTASIDDIIIPYFTGSIVANVQNGSDWKWHIIGLIICIIVIQALYSMIINWDSILIPSLEGFIRSNIVDTIEHYYDGKELQVGEIMSRTVKLPLVTSQVITFAKNVLLPYIISFVVTSVIVFKHSKIIGSSFFVLGTLTLTLYFISPMLCKHISLQRESKLAKIDDFVEDLLRNLYTVKISDTLQKELDTLRRLEEDYANIYTRTIYCTSKIKFVIIFLISILLVITGVHTYSAIENKTMTAAGFVTIFMIITQWCLSLAWISNKVGGFVMDWSIIRSYDNMIKHTHPPQHTACILEESEYSNESEKGRLQSGLKISHLTYFVENRPKPILDDVSFHMDPNTCLILKGSIGAGKTTLLKCIAGLLLYNQGSICLNGKPIQHNNIGYAQQAPILFDRTIYENIIYGTKIYELESVDVMDVIDDEENDLSVRTKEGRVYIESILIELDLFSVFSELEKGIDTRVGKNGNNLSGGQKQVIQLLRILLQNPDVLILDEITSSLDSNTKKKVLNLIDRMIKNKIVLMSTHDVDVDIPGSITLYMREGKIVV